MHYNILGILASVWCYAYTGLNLEFQLGNRTDKSIVFALLHICLNVSNSCAVKTILKPSALYSILLSQLKNTKSINQKKVMIRLKSLSVM